MRNDGGVLAHVASSVDRSRFALALRLRRLRALSLVACALVAVAPTGTASQRSTETHREGQTAPHIGAQHARNPDALSARERRKLEKDARRRALRCAQWLKGHLGWYFRRAAPIDLAQCLKMGASVTIRDRKGRTPLHSAAETTKDPDVVSRLVEAGADVMARTDDRFKDTPLHLAARNNLNVDVIARLIDLGADVNAKNEDRWQPLHIATRASRNPDIPALLIERGADMTSTVDYGRVGSVRKVSLWDLAKGNPAVHNSDWYRELEAQARQRKAAEEAKRLAALERQRKERERLVEEVKRKQRERLAEYEKRLRERERLAEEARAKQRKRLAEKAARIAKQRSSCEPALEEVGVIASWRKRNRVIADLNDDDASPLDAYADAIPFLIAGSGKHAEVEGAIAVRVLRDVNRWWRAGIENASEALNTWIGVAALLRKNCLHEIADYVVVNVVFEKVEQFQSIVFWETAATPPRAHPDVMRALEHIPHGILADVSATGRMRKIPLILEAAMKSAKKPFVTSCVDYFNAQSELREGHSLTSVQRNAFTEVCECFHDGADAKGYLADKPKFTDVMAELIDPKNVFSPRHADIKMVLGRCAASHGQSLK